MKSKLKGRINRSKQVSRYTPPRETTVTKYAMVSMKENFFLENGLVSQPSNRMQRVFISRMLRTVN